MNEQDKSEAIQEIGADSYQGRAPQPRDFL